MHLWAVHVHVESELLTDALDVLETFLVVGACTTDPDLDVVLVENGSDLTQSADDSLKCGGNLCNVSRHSSKKNIVARLTLVKLAIPPPMKRTLPSGWIGARSMRSRTVRA